MSPSRFASTGRGSSATWIESGSDGRSSDHVTIPVTTTTATSATPPAIFESPCAVTRPAPFAARSSRPSSRFLPPVRGYQDLTAALAPLRVGQRGLDLLDRVDLLDRRRQDPLEDLLAEVGVDRPDLRQRARGQAAAEDEPDQRLPAAGQRAARHHRVLAAH